MTRILRAAYAVVAYAGFLGVTGWAIAFVANLPAGAGIDGGHRSSGIGAVALDLGLLGLFAAHHSVMARPAVKRLLTRVLPAAAERSTYVLTADLLLALVLWRWRPITGTVWDTHAQPVRVALWTLYLAGWAIAIAATFMIDHWDLVGLRQAIGRSRRTPAFQARWLYTVVRHPLMLGLLIAFWATPAMTAGHLLFAAASSAYILLGIRFEERDLRRELGTAYARYAGRTPALMPRLRRRSPAG